MTVPKSVSIKLDAIFGWFDGRLAVFFGHYSRDGTLEAFLADFSVIRSLTAFVFQNKDNFLAFAIDFNGVSTLFSDLQFTFSAAQVTLQGNLFRFCLLFLSDRHAGQEHETSSQSENERKKFLFHRRTLY